MLKIKHILGSLLLCGIALSANAKTITDSIETSYRRSSLCSILVSRTDQSLHDKVQDQFLSAPTPNQYNNHDLSIQILNVPKKGKYADDIDKWLVDNQVASRLVGKWFNRDIFTGECSMDLIKERGLYNATEFDKELASRSPRGQAMLADAGEELIGNTFVLVHEAHYVDHGKRSKNAAMALRIVGGIASAALGVRENMLDGVASLTETIKGFQVKFHTRLYQLVWDDETSGTFYSQMWNNKDAFDAGRGNFRLQYVGEVTSSGSKVSFMGISEENPEIMIRKACVRAIDDNVRDLQSAYEAFRVKSPIIDVTDDKEVCVPIGMKEGISKDSEYEVLEAEEKDGKTIYHKIGTIAPIESKIWDNRYMAKEEGAVGSELAYTSFKVKSGKTPMAGHLVRQVK